MNEILEAPETAGVPNPRRRWGQIAFVFPLVLIFGLTFLTHQCGEAVGYRQPALLVLMTGFAVFLVLTAIYFIAYVRKEYWINFFAWSIFGLPMALILGVEIFTLVNFYGDESPVRSYRVEVLSTASSSTSFDYKVKDWTGAVDNFWIHVKRREAFSRMRFPSGVAQGDKLLIQTRAGRLGQEYYVSITKTDP